MQILDIFTFTETWMNSTIKSSDPQIVNFKEPLENHGRGGGVGSICKGFDRLCQEVRITVVGGGGWQYM